MRPVVFGSSHHTAPLEVRERLAVPSEQLARALALMHAEFGQAVILSTCNRTEFYTLAHNGGPDWSTFLQKIYPLEAESIERYFYRHEGVEAARHVFRVAAGLDSMLVGESQVLGQVRTAYSAAVTARTAHNPLSRLFHEALRVGKRARTETRLSRNELSVSSAAVRLARQAVGPLAGKQALVIGAGEAGRLAARALVQAGVGKLTVTNRTASRAEELARELNGSVVPYEEMPGALVNADIVVSATEAPDTVLTRAMLERARGEHSERALAVLDIAIPRDVDPDVRGLPYVALFDMDDLNGVAEVHRQEQLEEAAQAEAIVDEEVEKFREWWQSLDVVPTVASLRHLAEAIRKAEVARAVRRLPDLAPEEHAVVEAMSRALVKKLLHEPIATLKEHSDPRHVQAVHELFRLSGAEERQELP
ncbi:MAG: glutamyl-tRNA reductase [SAR202 cluster bacterium]|nr:glutamyl-tRNA reductase [SAR202 cluster bacterium]